MKINITARHFKAKKELLAETKLMMESLQKYFDGILKIDVVFSYEKNDNDFKTAEIILKVHNHVLRASNESDEFIKSLAIASKKIEKQLLHIKSKFREKDRKVLRKIKRSE